ncbi:hypothetical protein D3C73_828030 [compost metagenome]
MLGVEELLQHIGLGTIHQHQFAELFELVFGRERRHHHHRLVLFANPRIGNNEVFVDMAEHLVISQ